MKSHQTNLTKILFTIYLLALVWILLLKLGVQFSYMENREFNLIPFREAVLYNGKIDLIETIMNVIIFIPMGVYLPIILQKSGTFLRVFTVFLFSFMIESLQFIMKLGSFDITDIITNSFGGIIGLIFYFIVQKILQNSVKTNKFINIIALIGTLLSILFLFLLKTNRLGIRYQ